MTAKSTTVQAKLLSLGDVWFGERVTHVATNISRPTYVDVTLFDADTSVTRIVTFPADRWLNVTRDV